MPLPYEYNNCYRILTVCGADVDAPSSHSTSRDDHHTHQKGALEAARQHVKTHGRRRQTGNRTPPPAMVGPGVGRRTAETDGGGNGGRSSDEGSTSGKTGQASPEEAGTSGAGGDAAPEGEDEDDDDLALVMARLQKVGGVVVWDAHITMHF